MEPSEELRAFMLQIYQTMSNNAADFDRYLSQQPGVVAIGTAPNEWWQDYATISRIFKIQMEELGSVTVADANPRRIMLAASVGLLTRRPGIYPMAWPYPSA